ncbi:LysR family transcriptional regulator [Kaistia geumhonensis]|uniref:DNA-binding transcriptional LysR family regulator n=1 Tax=Kaistia geumhonensis TaxID=410839 RepID=A0ABU0M7C4_9HYPH|nr:LysR family transcriptional regulator [Kaistia geumhonensis]MCX5478081.1 LysR family transcriptional regulator [Kaistia geumhonensis]MDQ0516703.1 DNA-binding transcriptional LysR family regulator [Kaistia geumhonensis]
MRREDLTDLIWFLAVAEERSFTRAAARLRTSQSTLSHTIKQLEARLGLRLLTRTTRSVAPTEAGERLLASLGPHLAGIEEDLASLMALRDRPSGTVRISVSDHAFETVLWPRLQPVLASYPDIRLEFSIDNALRNIVEERFDAGVRLGESLDKDMIAVRASQDWRLVAVAAPAYFATRPRPRVPQDLVQHNCINHRQGRSGGLYAWEFEKDGRELRVRVEGQLVLSSSLPMVDAALAGFGIAYVPEDLVAGHVAAGRLVQVLDDWSPVFPGYFLYYPSRRQLSPAMTIVVDALRVKAGSQAP